MSRGLRNSKILLHSWIKTRTVLNVCRISATLSSSGSKNFSVSPTQSIQKTQPVETCSKNDGGFDFREFDVPTLITAIFVIVSVLMILVLFAKAFYEYLQEDETLKLHGPDSGSPKVSFWKKIWNEEESGKKKKDIKGVQSEGTDQEIAATKKDNSENTPSKKAGPDKKEEADEKWSFWKKKGVKQEDEKNGKENDEKIKQEDEKNGKNEESSWQWWKRKEDKFEKDDKPDKEKTEEKESREGENKEWFWSTKKDEKPDKDTEKQELVQISKMDDKNDSNKKEENVNKNDNEKKDPVSKKDGSPKKQDKSAKKVDNFYKYEDGYVDGYNTTTSSKVSAFVNQVIQLTIVVLTLIF